MIPTLLEYSQTEELLAQPESGMGWQLVDVEFDGGRTERALAMNAEVLMGAAQAAVLKSVEAYAALLTEASRSHQYSKFAIKSLHVVGSSRGAQRVAVVRDSAQKARAGAQGAADAPTENTEAGEVFKRFCAFAKDNRV